MTAPLVARLVEKIGTTTDPELRAVLYAELACYWARVGEFQEAERLRSDLRRDYGDGRSAAVSIMTMCLEALLLYYKDLSATARDRMLRANLLSRSFGLDRLKALTSAWLAHIDFNQNRLTDMAQDLIACFESISSDDGAALCRASLVLGDAFLFAGEESVSRLWYDRAHRLAVQIGDQAAIGAITYNRAGLHVSMARFRALSETIEGEELARMNAEVQTAINYQAVARLKSLDHLLDTAKVGVLMLGGNLAAAEPMVDRLLVDPQIESGSSQRALLLADLSLIRALSGRLDGLIEWIEGAADTANALVNPDDRAILLSAASKVANVLSLEERAHNLAAMALAESQAHWSCVLGLRNGIDRFKTIELTEV